MSEAGIPISRSLLYAHSPLTVFVDALTFGQKPVINYGEKTMVEQMQSEQKCK